MDKIVDSQFARVEKALQSLINSIATYNPNASLATELVNADNELTQGLNQLTTHQTNYARILALRSTSSSLDDQIRNTLTLLTSTRAELIATPATVFPENTNPVSYSELLSYARRISKFTIPPTFREPTAAATANAEGDGTTPAATGSDTPATKDAAVTKVEDQTQQSIVTDPTKASSDNRTNGSTTPILSNGIGVAGLLNGAGDNTTSTTPVEAQSSTALPQIISEYLNPLNGGPGFVPWPTEESIRRGALASIQVLLDQGVDPATFDPEKSAELEAERKRLEDEAERVKAEQEAERQRVEMERRVRAAEEQQHLQRRRESAAGGATGDQKPAVFTGLDLLEDDMDEDD